MSAAEQPPPPAEDPKQGSGAGDAASDSGSSAPSSGAPNPFNSLYVGDLIPEVNEQELYELFARLGPVVSVKLCRDIITRRSLGYAYVNYQQPSDAQRALEELNFMPLRNKPMRIMYSQRDPASRKSGIGNIFVKNLGKTITSADLHDTFGQFGKIQSCKISTDGAGNSRGYGFVQFEKQEAADEAIDKVNGMLLADRKVFVGPFVRRQDRDSGDGRFQNVYVKNLSDTCTEEVLKEKFGEHGEITSVALMRDSDGKSKGFGFVNFESPDGARAAVDTLDGYEHEGKAWVVNKAQSKAEREAELRQAKEQQQAKHEKFAGCNLYVKNLDDNVDDNAMRALFQDHGSITSCIVMKDENGASKGTGFVAFSTPEEATRAITEMNGKMPNGSSKPLYVALAQRKEDRRARLKAQFNMMSPMGMPNQMGGMPMYPGGGPGMPAPVMFQGGPPGMMQHPGMAYPGPPGMPGMMPGGMRPGMQNMPYYNMPMMPGMQGGGMGGGRGRGRGGRGGGMMQGQQGGRGPAGRGGPKAPTSAPAAPAPKNESASLLTQQLHNATPENRRTILGESLYPLIAALEPVAAAKVTGMLLEMDQGEVLHLIETPEELRQKVGEAIKVLKDAGQDPRSQGEVDAAAEGLQGMSVSS